MSSCGTLAQYASHEGYWECRGTLNEEKGTFIYFVCSFVKLVYLIPSCCVVVYFSPALWVKWRLRAGVRWTAWRWPTDDRSVHSTVFPFFTTRWREVDFFFFLTAILGANTRALRAVFFLLKLMTFNKALTEECWLFIRTVPTAAIANLCYPLDLVVWLKWGQRDRTGWKIKHIDRFGGGVRHSG